jgi:glycosyltransferase involved in cell wall biosynthesis
MSHQGAARLSVVALIPAFNPDEKLVDVVESLSGAGFEQIVVVNDGSGPQTLPVFERIAAHSGCTVLHHAENLGKGRALKTGLNHIYLACPAAEGVVTVDADGQHLAADAARVAAVFREHPDALVLGARSFGKETPLRSLVGNLATRHIFRFLVGRKISDTQSGLRCFSRARIPHLLQLAGEKYEYEMNMLIATKAAAIPVLEVPIATLYIEGNRSSHFNPFIDSMKIYFLLARFALSSVLAGLVDFLVFALVYALDGRVLTSFLVARAVSGSINFTVNKSVVFHSRDRLPAALAKYFALFVVLGTLAYLSIRTLADLGVHVIAAKIIAETLLFVASFSIQRDFIFVERAGATAGADTAAARGEE